MSKHLDFDTDFLKESTPVKVGTSSSASGPSNKPNKWKPWLIGGAIVLGVIFLVAISDSSSSSTNTTSNPTSNSSDDVTIGRYRCSSYNASRVEDLKPDIAEEIIDAESNALDVRIATLKSQKSRIENMYVDEYDQESIDNYNYEVDSYNSSKNRLNSDIAIYEAKLPQYNTQVNAYNSFLDNNCTRAY
ncbi:MAG: hypothetical protein WC880_03900 [Candidatus Paceibacterota bacterium]